MDNSTPNQSCSQPHIYRGHLFTGYEQRTMAVAILAGIMMIAEIGGGLWLGSMALLADGFHMGTHVGALGISAFAYIYARKHAHDARYSFGTGKVGDLAGFVSAIILGLVSLYVVVQSAERLISPVPIAYSEATLVAGLGLIVNIVSAIILHGGYGRKEHGREGHDHHHHDHNYRSAYVHVIADAVTSILALVALSCGWAFGWRWMDPVMGILGALVIASWARELVRNTAAVLLDHTPQTQTAEQVRRIIAAHGAEITDLHLWRVAPGAHAAIVAINAKTPVTADEVREWLASLQLDHVTVEVGLK